MHCTGVTLMFKKLSVLIATILCVLLAFAGCQDSTKPLANVDGAVKSGNGSFLVEKGDYVYFINGKATISDSNKFGDVEKGSLVRVKTSDLANPSKATVETVIPKLMLTQNVDSGVYFYGDYVFYATPSDNKDKTGAVKYTNVEYFKFDLTTGKNSKEPIVTGKTNTTEYKYIEKGDNVYLAFTDSEQDGSSTVNKLYCYDAMSGKKIFSSEAYTEIAIPKDGGVFYFTKTAYSEELKQAEAFTEIYSYEVGDSSAKLILSGAGSYGSGRDGRDGLAEDICFNKDKSFAGATFNLIKNTGDVLYFKATTVDSKYSAVEYFAVDVYANGKAIENFANRISYGFANTYIDAAMTSNSYFVAKDEIYYVDANLGLLKYDYSDDTLAPSHQRVLISKDAKSYAIKFVQDGYMYLASSGDGYYYRVKLEENAKCYKINGLSMQLPTDWYTPRVVGNYFVGSYKDSQYYGYVYVIDMTDIEEKSYETYLTDIAVVDEETVKKVNGTLLGKMTGSDKDAFEKYLDDTFAE